MTPYEFITKWRASALKERSASQEHFIDLCRLPPAAEADPTGATYCFERGARKDTNGDGWADVWKRHHFAWEYKGKRADLNAAFGQSASVRPGAGEPAAADRLRRAAVPHPHQLDEQRQQDLRVRPGQSGRRRSRSAGPRTSPTKTRCASCMRSTAAGRQRTCAAVRFVEGLRGRSPQLRGRGRWRRGRMQ